MTGFLSRKINLLAASGTALCLLSTPLSQGAELGDWIWMKGSNVANQSGVYGVKGEAAAVNTPGGRTGMATWTDAAGYLWVFGGYGHAASGVGYLNDLWKYDPGTNNWTWVRGTDAFDQTGSYPALGEPHADNTPRSRSDAATWTDNAGNLWLFGGRSNPAVVTAGEYLNDLWKFDPVTTYWTCVRGSNAPNSPGVYGNQGETAPANTPGARLTSVAWTGADGSMWLFGGSGFASTGGVGNLNDIWKYNPLANSWTWVKGTNGINPGAIYGVKGEPHPDSTPNGRYACADWTDANGNLWLFGGYSYIAPTGTRYNDLWKYDIAGNTWTWMNGSDISNQPGVYGFQGEPAELNTPGARMSSACWTDAEGSMWLFGGSGYPASAATTGNLDDLWKYRSDINTWVWVKGSSSINLPPQFGIQGEPSPANTPGSRYAAGTWKDTQGYLWLFGGTVPPAPARLNDLWKIKVTAPTRVDGWTTY